MRQEGLRWQSMDHAEDSACRSCCFVDWSAKHCPAGAGIGSAEIGSAGNRPATVAEDRFPAGDFDAAEFLAPCPGACRAASGPSGSCWSLVACAGLARKRGQRNAVEEETVGCFGWVREQSRRRPNCLAGHHTRGRTCCPLEFARRKHHSSCQQPLPWFGQATVPKGLRQDALNPFSSHSDFNKGGR